MTYDGKMEVYSPYFKPDKKPVHIPRLQRRCLSCIYGGDMVDSFDCAVDCRRHYGFMGHAPDWFCGEGQWEWIDKQGAVHVYHYAD